MVVGAAVGAAIIGAPAATLCPLVLPWHGVVRLQLVSRDFPPPNDSEVKSSCWPTA